MKKFNRALVILLVFALACVGLAAMAFAAPDTDATPYDGEGAVIVNWTKLSNVQDYHVDLVVDSKTIDISPADFSSRVNSLDITQYVKENGPGVYTALVTAHRGNYGDKHASDTIVIKQMDQPQNIAWNIDAEKAVVSWDAVEGATLGYNVKVTLTDAEGNVVDEQIYEKVDATSQDVTKFVAPYAANEDPLTLSAAVQAVGELTWKYVGGQKTGYLNSDYTDPVDADQLVGSLPKGYITNDKVEVVNPGQLTVDYELVPVADGIDYTYVDKLNLKLEGSSISLNKNVTENIGATGTIDVTEINANPDTYDWTVSLTPKYVVNAATVNDKTQDGEDGQVVFEKFDLPKPVLTVADDASLLSWPAVNADPEVVDDPTLFDDPERYEVYVKGPAGTWQLFTGGADTKVVYDDATGEMSVDISDAIDEGETKEFKVKVLNRISSVADTLDLRFTDNSEAVVEVYKTIRPTNVAFDVETYAFDNPPAEDVEDLVYLTWTLPDTTGIDHYLVTIYEDGEAAATFETEDANTNSIDVTSAIDNVEVHTYTADVVSIGKHANDDYSHFDADSGAAATAEDGSILSGAVASAEEEAVIEQQDDTLVLVVKLTDTNDNFDKVESVYATNLKNGKTSYEGPIQGTLSTETDSETGDTIHIATFDLGEVYEGQDHLKPGEWTADITVYSFNNGLNADTTVNVSATYDPEQLEIRGEELVDEEGNPTGEYGDPLVVDPESGEVSWLTAYAYDDETDEKIEDSYSPDNYYMVKLEYYNGSSWKSIKLQGGNDEEWENIGNVTSYEINDPDAPDGVGMVPGRVYRVVVQAFSDRPLVYAESDEESAYLCKFPAVIADITADADYPAGALSWVGSDDSFTYPDGTEYEINAGDYTDTATESPYSLYELLEEYGTYDANVTVLPMVVDDVAVGQENVTVNYVKSDVSNDVTAYRGVVPAEDTEDVEFQLESDGKVSLLFTLPTADDYTDDYDKAMADAIDTANVTVKLFTDNGTLLGKYDSVYDDATGVSTADVTVANEVSTAPNLTEVIDPGEKIFVAICVGSVTEYVDGYADFEVLEGDKSKETLAIYLSSDVEDDAVKVAELTLPEREKLNVTAEINTEDGTVVINDDEVQEDAQPTYTVDIAVKNADGSTTKTTYDGVDPDTPLDTSSVIKPGTEATVTVTASDDSGKYADAVTEMKAYKLTDPSDAAVDNGTGELTFTSDTTEYAYTNEVTFAPEGKATYDEESGVITFDLTEDAANVTTTVASIGGYDETNEIFVIDADNTTSVDTMAGLVPELTFVDNVFHNNDEGKQYTEATIDTNDDLYDAIDWENTTVTAKIGGTTYSGKAEVTNVADDGTATVTLTMDQTLDEGEYEVTVTPAIKADYAAVAAAEDLEGTVTYTKQQLQIVDLAVTDFATGEAAWSVDPEGKATNYKVTVSKPSSDPSGWTTYWEGTVDEPTFDLTEKGYEYEAGIEYQLKVQAISGDPDYADSGEDDAIILIYRLTDPAITKIAKSNGAVTYTHDTTYAHVDTFTTSDANANVSVDGEGKATATFDLTVDPQDVTVTLTCTGQYDSDASVYVLDAVTPADYVVTAGLDPLLSDPTLSIDPATGNQILMLKIDENNPLYAADWDNTPNDWANMSVTLSGGGKEVTVDNITHKDNVRTNPGYLKVNFGTSLENGVDYTITVDDAIRSKFQAVAGPRDYDGPYTIVDENQDPITVSLTANQLVVSNLHVEDFATGKAAWDVEENSDKVANYKVTVSKPSSDPSGWTTYWEGTVDEMAFDLTEKGYEYEAGTEYQLKVQAISGDLGYDDSGEDDAIIFIYRLTDPEITRILNSGVIEYTHDTTYDHVDTFSADNNATVDDSTATVTFDLTADPPQEVTVTLACTGKEITANERYVLDAENVATATKTAGLAPIFSDATLTIDENGDQILTLKIDMNNPLYGKKYSLYPSMWKDVKITASNSTEGDVTVPITSANNVDYATGTITINFKNKLVEDTEYDILVQDVIKDSYSHIAGARPEYSAGTVNVAAPVTPPDAPVLSVDPEEGVISWGDGGSLSPEKKIMTRALLRDDAASEITYHVVVSQYDDSIWEDENYQGTSFTPNFGGGEGEPVLNVGEVYTVTIHAVKDGVESEGTSVDIYKQEAPVAATLAFEKNENGAYTGNYTAEGGVEGATLTADVFIGQEEVTKEVEAPSYVNDDIIAGELNTVTIQNAKFSGFQGATDNVYYFASEAAERDLVSDFKVGKLPALTVVDPTADDGLTTEDIANEDGTGTVEFTFTPDEKAAIEKALLALGEADPIEGNIVEGKATFTIPAETMAAIAANVEYTATLVAANPAVNADSTAEGTIAYVEPAPAKEPIPAVDPLYYGVFADRANTFNTANNGGATLYFKEVELAKLKKNGGYVVTIADSSTNDSYTFSNDQLNGRSQLPAACVTDDYFVSVKRIAINRAVNEEKITANPANWTVTITDYPLDEETYMENTAVFTLDGTGDGSEESPAGFAEGLIEAIPVETILANAKAFVYPGDDGTSNAYKYIGIFTVSGSTVTYSCSYAAAIESEHQGLAAAAIADMARFLGAIHRGNEDGTVNAITYNGVDYTWDTASTLKGSKWTDADSNTLVSVLTADLGAQITGLGEYTVSFQIDGKDVNVTIALTN
ncbi:MAG: hypothetical protein K6B40_01395 [Firmicutes bacterium]|nr:hypothetical protein [Bacillota bacterium]